MLLEARVAHYVALMRYERRWEGARREDFERDLAAWLTRLVAAPDCDHEEETGVRCCRAASIVPFQAGGKPGQWPPSRDEVWWMSMVSTESGGWPITVSLTPRDMAPDASYTMRFRVGPP